MRDDFKILRDIRLTTTKLTVLKKDGTEEIGTGFFYRVNVDKETGYILLVTCKHLCEDWVSVSFKHNRADDRYNPIYGDTIPITLKNTPFQGVLEHPEADIIAFAVGPQLNYLKKQDIILALRYLDENKIPKEFEKLYINPVEEIYIVGYPEGEEDRVNNMPITRKGITATDFNLDYNGHKEFMIDAPVFRGNSGSPVIVCSNHDLNHKEFFLGVVYDTSYLEAYEDDPAHYFNVGYCVKSECLKWFKEEIIRRNWK